MLRTYLPAAFRRCCVVDIRSLKTGAYINKIRVTFVGNITQKSLPEQMYVRLR